MREFEPFLFRYVCVWISYYDTVGLVWLTPWCFWCCCRMVTLLIADWLGLLTK